MAGSFGYVLTQRGRGKEVVHPLRGRMGPERRGVIPGRRGWWAGVCEWGFRYGAGAGLAFRLPEIETI
jgi:hypothetical protein